MHRVLIIFLFLLSNSTIFNPVFGQAEATSEEVVIHFDKAFYVSGEVVWYKIYLPITFQAQNVAIKAGLYNQTGESIADYFIMTDGETSVEAYFKIPYNISSDVYHLVLLGTDRQTKQRVKLSETFIPIYNDLLEEGTTGVSPGKEEIQTIPSGNLQLSISLDKASCSVGEECMATIEVKDKSGQPIAANLSISVTDANLVRHDLPSTASVQSSQKEKNYDPATLESDIYINGQVQTSDGLGWESYTLGAFSAMEEIFYFSQPDANGFFALQLPDFKGSKPIQFMDYQRDDIKTILQEGITLAPSRPVVYTEAVKTYLKWSQRRKIIYQLYNSLETKLALENYALPALQSLPADERIILKDYATFTDFYSFFMEVSRPLKIRKEKGDSLSAQMFNPKARIYFQGSPIFIVDGQLTRNVNFIQQLDINKIDTIDLYFSAEKLNRQFGRMGNGGVVVIKTSIPDLEVPSLESGNIHNINGLLPPASIAGSETENPDVPDFRPQLFWSSTLSTDANGQLKFSFPQSDDLGDFQIEVMAQGQDGKLGHAVKKYQVQWKP